MKLMVFCLHRNAQDIHLRVGTLKKTAETKSHPIQLFQLKQTIRYMRIGQLTPIRWFLKPMVEPAR